jgi:hypothetical protein
LSHLPISESDPFCKLVALNFPFKAHVLRATMGWSLGLTSLVAGAAEEDQAFELLAAAPLPTMGGLLLDVAAVAPPPCYVSN